MTVPETSTLENFHRFIGEQLQMNAAVRMSPEQALALWRDQQETVQAIREGLADVDAGRTKPLEQFRREIEARHGIIRE